MNATTEWLQREIERAREDRQRALADLRETVRSRVDVPGLVRAHPLVSVGAATAGGYAAARTLRSPRVRAATRRGLRRAPSWAARGRAVLTFLGLLA